MNWTFCKITSKKEGNISTNGNKYITFGLNYSVAYRDGVSSFISFYEGGYSALSVGDEIQIDTGRLRSRGIKDICGPGEALLYFNRSHWEDEYWKKNDLANNLREQRDNWKKKCEDLEEELKELKEEHRNFSNKLEGLQNEKVKIIMENAKDKLLQKEVEAKLQIDRAKNEERLKHLEESEEELRKQLEEKDKLSQTMIKQLVDLKIHNVRTEGENRRLLMDNKELLGKDSDSKSNQLEDIADELSIDFKLLAKLKRLHRESIEAREKGEKEVYNKCEEEIAIEKDNLRNNIHKDDIKKLFDKCKEVAKTEVEVDKVNAQQRHLEAKQEVHLITNK